MGELRRYPLGAGGIVTRVIEGGEPDAPAVLFIHGMGARADRWTLNLGAAADAGFRAVALDLPGHGFATKGTGPAYSVGGYATFVVGALGLLPVGPDLAKGMAASLGRQTPRAISEKLQFVVGDHSIVSASWIFEESMVNTSPGAEEGLRKLAEYVVSRLDEDLVGPRLAVLEPAPHVQLVWGAIDRPVPLDLGVRASERYGWPLRVIDGAGHVVYRERADEFNDVLLGFLGVS